MKSVLIELTGKREDLETAITLIADFKTGLQVKAGVIKDGSKIVIKETSCGTLEEEKFLKKCLD